MLRKLFSKPTNSIASAAVIVASFSVLSRFVGFIRDRILAGEFGASKDLDVYFAAFRIPDLFYQLLVVGALSASFIPLFTKYFEKRNKSDAWFLTNNVLNIVVLAFGLLAIVGVIFASSLSRLVAPGFAPEDQAMVAQLTQVMMLAQLLMSGSMVFGSALQGAKRFVVYSLAPVFYNVGIIIGVLVFVPLFGANGLAWGVVLGAFCHFIVQWVGVVALGYRYRPIFSLRNPDSLYILKHMPPRVLGLAINQLNLVAMTGIASYLMDGSISMFQFAYNLNFFPIGVVAVSYAIACFPTLCETVNRGHNKEFISTISSTIRQMMLFIIPATVLFILLRAQIVRVVLGAGEFSWDATILTADTLGWFAVSFFAQAIILVLVRAYFARGNSMTPFLVAVMSAAVNIVLALYLSERFDVIGLGMAYSLANLFQVVILWIPLRVKIGSLDEWRIGRSMLILSASALVCAAVTQSVKVLVGELGPINTFFGILGQGMAAGLSGLAAFTAIAYLMKSEELNEFLASMRRRLFRKTRVAEPMVMNPGADGG